MAREGGWFPNGAPPEALTQVKGLATRDLVQITQDDTSDLIHTHKLLLQLFGAAAAWEQLDVRLQVRAVLFPTSVVCRTDGQAASLPCNVNCTTCNLGISSDVDTRWQALTALSISGMNVRYRTAIREVSEGRLRKHGLTVTGVSLQAVIVTAKQATTSQSIDQKKAKPYNTQLLAASCSAHLYMDSKTLHVQYDAYTGRSVLK